MARTRGITGGGASDSQSAINIRLYQQPKIVRQYAAMHELYPAEAAVLAAYGGELADCTVLDLGCGAGRLVPHLQPLASHYVGIDVSPHMVAYCRSHFPDLEFSVGDMRALRAPAAAFGAVFAIANLFDAVDHAERSSVLRSVHRVLAPGGLLVFSSHNRNWSGMGAPPALELTGPPLALLRCTARYALARARQLRARVRHLEHHTADYSVVTDPGHEFGVLHYYISRATQAAQLADHGFALLATFCPLGRPLAAAEDDRAFPSLVYVARRS